MDIKLIEIDKIVPNSYNPNVVPEDIMAKLRAEIRQKRLCEPIIVRKRGNVYEIVDGEHRWRICRELGWKEMPCIVQDYDDQEAKIKTIQLNYMRGSALPLKMASLIHELNRGITVEDLAKRLPYEKPQMMDSLELLKLPDNFGNELEQKAHEEKQEMPSVISFVVYKEQMVVIEEAIKAATELLPQGVKNLKALALEKICSGFLEARDEKRRNTEQL